MRKFLEAVAVLISLLGAFNASAQEYTGWPLWPANELAAKHAAEYPWRFAGCIEVIDMTQLEEPTVTVPAFNLVYDGDPAHETFVPREDGNAPFLIGETWFTFDTVNFATLCLQT